MKNSFIRLLLRDIKNYIRTNRFFLIAEAALFLIGCMIADMQKPDSYGKYTTIQYYMQIFRGCYPFTDARTEVFQVPLTWFTLMYFCIYTALLYPIRDASGAGIHVLLRAKSRALWWFSKCLALTVWNLLYFAVGFCSVCVFCFFTNGLSCFTILPYDGGCYFKCFHALVTFLRRNLYSLRIFPSSSFSSSPGMAPNASFQ